jgi:hypothetical protein
MKLIYFLFIIIFSTNLFAQERKWTIKLDAKNDLHPIATLVGADENGKVVLSIKGVKKNKTYLWEKFSKEDQDYIKFTIAKNRKENAEKLAAIIKKNESLWTEDFISEDDPNFKQHWDASESSKSNFAMNITRGPKNDIRFNHTIVNAVETISGIRSDFLRTGGGNYFVVELRIPTNSVVHEVLMLTQTNTGGLELVKFPGTNKYVTLNKIVTRFIAANPKHNR